MNAYEVEHWHDFLVAQAGAGAALTGLVFVALSINLSRIIAAPILPGRAAEALILLLALLVGAMAGLIPGQDIRVLGLELLIVGGVFWGVFYYNLPTQQEAVAAGASVVNHRVRASFGYLATIPLILCGVSLAAGFGGGLYWLPFASLFCLAAGVVGAWVLLIEIVR